MTLIELMVTVSITGILATAGALSFQEQVNRSHSVEAVAMLGTMQKAVSVAGIDAGNVDSDLNFNRTTFGNGNGNNDGGIDGDGNKGHGNNDDGCDPDNPGGCDGSPTSDDSGNSGNGSNKDGGIDGDGNNGHGNNDDGCDPDNPGKSGNCSGGPDNDGSGSDGIDSLCDSASPVPASLDSVRGKVYNAPPSSWSSGSSSAGWSCLKVSRSGNQRYQFGYDKGAGNLSESDEGYTAWARGDLDGDGRNSLFRVRGDLVNGTVVHGVGVEIIDGNE